MHFSFKEMWLQTFKQWLKYFFFLFYSEKMGWKLDGLRFNLHHSFKHTFASALHLQRSAILRVNLCFKVNKTCQTSKLSRFFRDA